jgi:tRNA threonylcarbamoyladenosine biosynthesis protein TsaE
MRGVAASERGSRRICFSVESGPTIRLFSRGAGDTTEIGRAIGRQLESGDVVVLSGPLGAGKTTLTQGIAEGLGVDDYVTSPTFTLVNEYRSRQGKALYHVDLYRTSGSAEALDLGLDEYLGLADLPPGVAVLEWAERALDALPATYLLVRLERGGSANAAPLDEVADEPRLLTIHLRGERYERRRSAFTDALREYAAGD